MKKNILKVAFVAAIALVSGINVFNSQKTENLSDVVLANVEALAMDEVHDNIIRGKCEKAYHVTTECHVECGCGTIWYPEQRMQNAIATNVSGRCKNCGNTMWNSYN